MTTGWKGVLFGVCVLGMVSASACNADRSPPSAGGAGGLPNGSGGSGTDSMGGLGGAAFEEALRIDLAADAITAYPGQVVYLHGQPFGGLSPYDLVWEQLSGSLVLLTDDSSPNPSFIAPSVGATETLTFSIHATDEHGSEVSRTVNVIVEVPQVVVDAGPDVSVTEGQSVSLHALATGGAGSYRYSWSQAAGPSVVLGKAESANPTFVAPPASAGQTIELELAVTSGGVTVTDTVKIAVVADPISLNAGPDQDAGETQQVSLHARGSGGAGTLSFLWMQSAGPAATLLGPTKKNPSIVAPVVSAPTVVSFTVEATDGVRTESDTVDITVLPSLPSVSAGSDGQALESQVTQLAGDALGGFPPYTYSWTQTSGTSVSLTQADTLTPTFGTPDVSGNETLTFELEVTDSVGHVVSDTVDVVIYDSPTQALAALAGPTFHVPEGGLRIITGMALGGTGPFSYAWQQPPSGSEPQLSLSSPNTAPERLIVGAPAVDSNQLATLQLDVTDSLAASATDTTTLVIDNIAFTASAGTDRSVLVSDQVQLQGVTAEARGAVNYDWSQVSGPTVSLLQAHTANPSFVPTATGTVVLSLTAKDSINTASDTVSIVVTAPPVTADAGVDATVSPLDTVYLNGAAGSGVGPYAFVWSQLEGPTIPLSAFKTDNPSFAAPKVAQATVLKFQVTVTDGAGSIATDTVNITVTPVPLIVDLGTGQKVYSGTRVSLHASATGGTPPLNVEWSVQGGTGKDQTVIENANSLNAVVTPFNNLSSEGLLLLKLTVTDAGGQTVTKSYFLRLYPYVQPPLRGLVCGDYEQGVTCTDQERAPVQVAECPVSRPFPVSILQRLPNSAPGQYLSYATCWPESTCKAFTFDNTRNKPECNPAELSQAWDGGASGAELRCFYCCVDDECNVPVQPDASLLYRPDYVTNP